MCAFRRWSLLLLLLLSVALPSTFFILRSSQAAYGPLVASCPGADGYGYTCQRGTAFAYVDATHDTELYQDDALVSLPLPFPFTFYGTTFTELYAGSNGNIQFANSNPSFFNDCMDVAPAAGMGDMIAPYWDDLDLRFAGTLKYEVVGHTPNRIFVLEWDDVPRFGPDLNDRVTFEVQLFEQNDDIVFLYQDTTTTGDSRGRSATVGLQSEAQGLALQFSCDQPVVADPGTLHFPHPVEPNPDFGRAGPLVIGPVAPVNPSASMATRGAVTGTGVAENGSAKGVVAEAMVQLERFGIGALTRLRGHWLSQAPARLLDWRQLDLDGDGSQEIVLLWRGTRKEPQLAEVAILRARIEAEPTLILARHLSTRQDPLPLPQFGDIVDVTGDGLSDVLLRDRLTGQLFVVNAATGQIILSPVPERCQGSLVVLDNDGDGRPDIVRDGCTASGRTGHTWNGEAFTPMKRP